MKARTRLMVDRLGAAAILAVFILTGCDMGMEQSSNRYEQLNIETKKLNEILEKVTDEASAKANQPALVQAADGVRDVQKRIADAEAKRAEKGGGGMGNITNFRQASLFEQTGDAARRHTERIRNADPKAGEIVDKAMEGIELPPPPMEAPVEF
jgi:hypothetical protein